MNGEETLLYFMTPLGALMLLGFVHLHTKLYPPKRIDTKERHAEPDAPSREDRTETEHRSEK